MNEMEETVKQLKLDEGELGNKLQRRKQELERAEKRLKGIENVKPEYQEEYERLEIELERFYSIYVEKFTNIDYLEYELDMYNLKEKEGRKKQQDVINKLKNQQKKAEKEEIFNDDREEEETEFRGNMGNTQKGFSKKFKTANLQPEDEEYDEEEGVDEEEEDDENMEQEDDDDENSDHNF